MNIFLFAMCAGIGGASRFLIEYYLPPIGSTAFPRATLLVNLIGAFILGLTVNAGSEVKLLVGSAFCGALTTFSGVCLQLYRRISSGAWSQAFTYLVATLAFGLSAAYLGAIASSHLFG